jgi:hypothetical protein
MKVPRQEIGSEESRARCLTFWGHLMIPCGLHLGAYFFFKYNLCLSPSSVSGGLDHSFDQLLRTLIRGGRADHVLVLFLVAGDPKLAP